MQMTGIPRLDELAGDVFRLRATHDLVSRRLAD
jgi:hypothetical protein